MTGRASRSGRLLVGVALAGALAGEAVGRAADVPIWSANAASWTASASDGVHSAVAADPTGAAAGTAQLDFDFAGHGGWAILRQAAVLPPSPENYELRLHLQGTGAVNDLEIKLVDAKGENVWWWTRRGEAWPAAPAELRFKKRQLSFAWGPAGGGEPRDIAAIEIAVVARAGGKGTLRLAGVEVVARPPAPVGPLRALASADRSLAGGPASAAVDGDPATSWRSGPLAAGSALTLDLGVEREFGGLTVQWEDTFAADYDVELSPDGSAWSRVRAVRESDGGSDDIALPESESRYVRLRMLRAPAGGVAVREVVLQPLAWGATPNAFVRAVAGAAPRGDYPRGFLGEQAYWTIVGVAGGVEKGLLGEDGAIEGHAGGPAVEPFLRVDGTWFTWADVDLEQGLRDGDLPMPWVRWRAHGVELAIETFADGPPTAPAVCARYAVRALDGRAHAVELALAVRSFQVNPASQFLNGVGGVAPIRALSLRDGTIRADERVVAQALSTGGRWIAVSFDGGGVLAALRRGEGGGSSAGEDAAALASAALVYDLGNVDAAGRAICARLPSGPPDAAAPPDAFDEPARWFTTRADAVAQGWRERLGRFALALPTGAPPLAAAMRTALAHVLILADGPALQPGARSYRRAWIRDGALMSEALLRLGQGEEASAFLSWYGGFQFEDGRIPCCVDRRGADPVPENDAPGEFLHLVSDVWRFGGDRALLDAQWPRVERTVAFLEGLRQQRRTAAYRTGAGRAFFGLLPESISHEGYSAKPMHSFWDDFWALRGLEDAVGLAKVRGDEQLAARWTRMRDEFEHDLYAALAGTIARHGMEVLPGCVELGDFDPTSSTIALAPGGQLERLPPAALRRTFARYMEEAEGRWSGGGKWDAYTPYEWRIVGSLVRLGERSAALKLLGWLLADRRLASWNQWPEVVRRDARQEGFLGDLPHGWIEADFLRSALDLFAYERDSDRAMVLAAGVDERWLDGEGVSIRGMRTPYGILSYRVRRIDGKIEWTLAGDGRVPPGGLVLAAPADGPVRRVTVDGKRIATFGVVRVRHLPAQVTIELER